MVEIRKPAVAIQQGLRRLYVTSFTVRDVMRDGLYRVDRLDVQEGTGLQRLLNESRARGFARDLVDADEHNQAFLPTSVFLATEGSVSYDERSKEIFFDDDEAGGVCPFDVVDGQHRLEGLKAAATSKERLLDFPISVVIAHEMSEAERMLQFLIVNTKQQPVDKGVAQHITARFTRMDGVQELPYLPKWLDRDVKRGSDDQALEIVRQLNSDSDSPWRGRIQLADDGVKSPRHTIKQKTFVTAVKRNILNQHHPYNNLSVQNEGKRVRVLINYWRAVDKLFVGVPRVEPSVAKARRKSRFRRVTDPGTNSIVYKNNGTEFFLSIFSAVLSALARDGNNYTENAFRQCLKKAAEHLDPRDQVAMAPEFWESGGRAAGMNRSGIGTLAHEFRAAITQANQDEVQV